MAVPYLIVLDEIPPCMCHLLRPVAFNCSLSYEYPRFCTKQGQQIGA